MGCLASPTVVPVTFSPGRTTLGGSAPLIPPVGAFALVALGTTAPSPPAVAIGCPTFLVSSIKSCSLASSLAIFFSFAFLLSGVKGVPSACTPAASSFLAFIIFSSWALISGVVTMLVGVNPGGWILNPSMPVTCDGAGPAGGVVGAPGVTDGAGPSGLVSVVTCFSGPLPNAASVAAVIPAPPKPPFSPALMKRSKFFSEKKSWFLSTKFSAAADDISCNASVPPSVTKP